jgi:hypothetical protein
MFLLHILKFVSFNFLIKALKSLCSLEGSSKFLLLNYSIVLCDGPIYDFLSDQSDGSFYFSLKSVTISFNSFITCGMQNFLLDGFCFESSLALVSNELEYSLYNSNASNNSFSFLIAHSFTLITSISKILFLSFNYLNFSNNCIKLLINSSFFILFKLFILFVMLL